ncbi:cell wall / vacuolar inhibitor of fructosidase 1 [Neltuma alba]|uniref:cell wall / vacuolar inhibitor of fructosidase 1 n=1 Tax=Neltuma alba TaxID=207710 RepID=UPI0010A2E56B|nr:cell wall / vacuolar inhibitor of fructosidase 1-like [Prosopis alba]
MTNLKSLRTIIFIVTTIFIVSPSSCSRAGKIHPHGKTLIETTCKNTPNYNLCVQSLKSDPASSVADVAGLGLIMVKVTAAKAKAASNRINQLLHRGRVGAKQEKALRSCAEMYKVVVENDVPEAIEALKKGDPKFGEDGVRDAQDEATYCEEEFSGVKSPLTRENNAVRNAAAVTVAIVRQLL